MDIPDGEYDLALSDAVLAQLAGPSGGVGREGPELMSLLYNDKPENLDDTKPKEVEITGDSFKLRAASKSGESVLMEGTVSRAKSLECIVLYNKESKSFEMKKLGLQLRASSVVKADGAASKRSGSLPEETKPLKKRKEPSIFQPKARARSPMEPQVVKKSPASTSDDDLPLSKMASPKRPSSTTNKPSAPSPLSSAHTATTATTTTTTTASTTAATSPLKHSTSAATLSASNATAPKMRLTQSTSIPSPRLPVAGKRPPSSVSTPTIVQESPSSDEDEFNDLVDELEEELSDENNFITIEDPAEKRKPKEINPPVTTSSPMGGRPISFRSMAGSNDDEEDITSSEEE